MQVSLKVKILATIITLTLTSLGLYSLLSFNSYKKDKLAFVYDHLASETQSKSMLITSTIESYETLLSSIISRIDLESKNLPPELDRFLAQKTKFIEISYHFPLTSPERTIFKSPFKTEPLDWKVVHTLPFGLTVSDRAKSHFSVKKRIESENGYVLLTFQNTELLEMLKAGAGRHSFIIGKNTILSKEHLNISKESKTQLFEQIQKSDSQMGIFERLLDSEEYLVSYARLPIQDLVMVSLIKKKNVLLIQNVFLKQVLIFLVLMGSVSLFIGAISSRWITFQLDRLTQAAKELGNENFDYVVKIESNDELGLVGKSFNTMSSQIRKLLEELRRYNLELEQMVDERTFELQNLSNIQRAMLNSLGQAFVIVDSNHQIRPIYSKISTELFEIIPDQSSPGTILCLNSADTDSFKELFKLAFEGMLDFDDLAKMSPGFRSNSKGQKIQLTYAPIRDAESDRLDYVLVIGTDKTLEIENMEKLKKEWNFSQMVIRMVSNRYALVKVLRESLHMISESIRLAESDKPYFAREVQRNIHTVKGSFSYFHVEEVTSLANQIESDLGPFYDSEFIPAELKWGLVQQILNLQISIECYIEKYDSLIQFQASNLQKTIPAGLLREFGDKLRSQSQTLYPLYRQYFYQSDIQPFFQLYPDIVKELGTKLNKTVRFVIEGGDQKVPDGDWEQLFNQFIHFVRNSVDHGLETESERIAAGKSPCGEIKFAFKKTDNKLFISLSDDGKGVDWKKIAAKDPSIRNEQEALDRIAKGGVSSKEEVSDVSGRGVGVSSIFAKVKSMNGEIEISNNYGKGIALNITIPLERVSINRNAA
jgi:two-component system, chemotaxis family, sensor kinase CheA